jgi:ATP-dependent protease ClpP protease subunit
MPSLQDITEEANPTSILSKYLKQLNKLTKRNIIIYYSGCLTINNPETGINDYDKNGFMSVVHELDTEKGLDLILHTPGGSTSATESIIYYLRQKFGSDIRAIVPQLAMLAGTMIACACKEIIMGKQSILGPIDPQIFIDPNFGFGAAHGIIEEFERAKKEMKDDVSNIHIWQPIIAKYTPTLIGDCQKVIDWSEEILEENLKNGMFKELPENERNKKIKNILEELGSHALTKAHDRHISPEKCEEIGLKISMMEDEDKLQDVILSVHHACIYLINSKRIVKVIKNHHGKSFTQEISK